MRLGRGLSRLVASFGLLALASCVAAPPTEVSVSTYEVSGDSLNSLQRSASAHGPPIPGSPARAFAAVEYNYLHSFEPVEEAGRCRYNSTGRVGLRAEVILPEWRQRDRNRASPDLQRKWDVLARYASIHEAGHIRISQKYARLLEGVFRRSTAPTCQKLDAEASRDFAGLFQRLREEQELFDATDEPRFRRYLRRNGYTLGPA
ncbi:DUF922 domain-containing protein [Acuticoccus sp.]|uniref:DUF922 domain-containing protein n=1 Tax=Acuticoccus sp. TaxID=1904378 RepID=UPI003B5167A4